MKKILNIFLYTALFSIIANTATAQTVADYLRAAEGFYKEGDYYSAAINYEKYLTGTPGKIRAGYNPYVVQKVASVTTATSMSNRKDVVYKLAESYRMINYFSKAEPYYREAADMGPVYPLAAYWHAKCQRAMGNLDAAEAEFKTFQTTYTAQDDISKDIEKELASLNFVKTQINRKDLARYTVTKSDKPLNGTGANYAPFFLGDGTLTFTSTRIDTGVEIQKGKNPYTNKVYQAGTNSTISTEVQKVKLPADLKMEQGVATFTPDGNKMFVTKWIVQSGRKVAAIYSSTKTADSWTTPVKLPATINPEGASTQQPFVTADGKYLLFSSDRAGGNGKFDIWYATLNESFEPAAEVTNLGFTINTTEDDEAPFYHLPSKTLVVASNGRTGMGGFDLYSSKGDFTTWETPANMGQPVNSIKDDIYYASSDKKSVWNNALLSSDRDSPCCLEMYAFDRKSLPKNITGTVVDCSGNKPLAGASVSITDAGGKIIATKTTDASGRYSLTLADYETLKVAASNTGYNPNSINVAAPETEEDTYTNPAVCLTLIPEKPIEEGKAVVLENVLYDFNKATLKPGSFVSLDTLVNLMKKFPAMEVEVGAHTDNIGNDKYNMALSEKRAKSCVAYLIKQGIEATRLQTKGYGESQPVAENTIGKKDNPEGRAKNRRTEFKIIHY